MSTAVRSTHANPRSLPDDVLRALGCAALAWVALAGFVLALVPAVLWLLWMCWTPVRAEVDDRGVCFDGPFYNTVLDPARLRARWIVRPFRSDGRLLLRVGWRIVQYRPDAFSDPRPLADAVARALAAAGR